MKATLCPAAPTRTPPANRTPCRRRGPRRRRPPCRRRQSRRCLPAVERGAAQPGLDRPARAGAGRAEKGPTARARASAHWRVGWERVARRRGWRSRRGRRLEWALRPSARCSACAWWVFLLVVGRMLFEEALKEQRPSARCCRWELGRRRLGTGGGEEKQGGLEAGRRSGWRRGGTFDLRWATAASRSDTHRPKWFSAGMCTWDKKCVCGH